MFAVADKEVAAYSGLVDSLARRLAGLSGAEYDDLYQEGMIAVALTLTRGLNPSREHVRHRMLNWCRYIRRLLNNDAVAYEKLLAMEHHAIDAV